MRILIVTPLYPPDIAGHAPYVKELAVRLSSEHDVTVLAYNHLPEQVSNVTIIPIEKSARLVMRLSRFTSALYKCARRADIIYVQNGPSVEFPVYLASHFFYTPFYFRLGDNIPLRLAESNHGLSTLLVHTMRRARGIIRHSEIHSFGGTLVNKVFKKKRHTIICPLQRPEILPFEPYPTEAFTRYEQSWVAHVRKLVAIFQS